MNICMCGHSELVHRPPEYACCRTGCSCSVLEVDVQDSMFFDDRKPFEFARSSDPDTSHEAAAEVVKELSGKCEYALFRLRVYVDDRGVSPTACELEEANGISNGSIRKRLNDLRIAGKIERREKRKCLVTGRSAWTWAPVS